ncbi:methyl-accepting chemotaxis protein [Salinicola avicenniae]|uniref:methyl-accepting chemotaxis protein n=1 Tax=Salinicola avicenniae TaxID=2916836 RepID=UPI002074424B|nr:MULTISPECIES: methyl-accepting chemotaxis protein [unclassified Salinicola]
MKRIDDLTVRTSWILVVAAFALLVLAEAGLAAYAVNTGGQGLLDTGWLNMAIGITVVMTVLLVGIILWGVTANVIRPLNRLVGHFERLADGDLSGAVESRGNNEIGRLFKALESTRSHLARTVGNVRRASDNVHGGATDIAQGNTDLSSRTEQQAASLEETAASMEQLTSTVRQNTDNARQASQLADEATGVANRGGEVVGQVVTTMHEISANSRQAVENLDTIDSLAFQTNILALNASVEAARAGEQGRGFAVVASEVQTLARRSADAAKQIRELIQGSAERVEAGTKLVDNAGATMTDIVSAISHVNDIMREIVTASEEQTNGITQVNQAITQMDEVTQQNAALVQQAANAARTLEQEADELQTLVAIFRLDAVDSATPRMNAPAPQRLNAATPMPAQATRPSAAPQTNRATEAEEWTEF